MAGEDNLWLSVRLTFDIWAHTLHVQTGPCKGSVNLNFFMCLQSSNNNDELGWHCLHIAISEYNIQAIIIINRGIINRDQHWRECWANFWQKCSGAQPTHCTAANKTEPFIRWTYIKWLMHYLNTLQHANWAPTRYWVTSKRLPVLQQQPPRLPVLPERSHHKWALNEHMPICYWTARRTKVKHECVGSVFVPINQMRGLGWSSLPKGPLTRHQTSIRVTRLAPRVTRVWCNGHAISLIPQVLQDQQVHARVVHHSTS